jgi:hypothetical protein
MSQKGMCGAGESKENYYYKAHTPTEKNFMGPNMEFQCHFPKGSGVCATKTRIWSSHYHSDNINEDGRSHYII